MGGFLKDQMQGGPGQSTCPSLWHLFLGAVELRWQEGWWLPGRSHPLLVDMNLSVLPLAEVNLISLPGILSPGASPAQSISPLIPGIIAPPTAPTLLLNTKLTQTKKQNLFFWLLLPSVQASGVSEVLHCNTTQNAVHRWVWPQTHYDLW